MLYKLVIESGVRAVVGGLVEMIMEATSETTSKFLFNQEEDNDQSIAQGLAFPDKTDTFIKFSIGVVAGAAIGIPLGMAIMYCIQRKQPSTQVTYNISHMGNVVNVFPNGSNIHQVGNYSTF